MGQDLRNTTIGDEFGTHNQDSWEPWVKVEHTFEGLNVLWGEGDVEGLQISM